MTKKPDMGDKEDADKKASDENEYPPINFFKLFRSANAIEKILTIFGCLCSALVGAGLPASVLIFREMVNDMIPKFNPNIIDRMLYFYIGLALLMLILSFCQMLALQYSSKRQARRLRQLYLKAVVRQDVPWFDTHPAGELINTLSENIFNIEQGIGSKLGESVQNMVGFVTGITIGFVIDYRLAGVAFATLPIVVGSLSLFGITGKYFVQKELAAYSKASSITNEVLTAIRTVVAFGGEKRETKRYSNELKEAKIVAIRKSTVFGGLTGLVSCVMFCTAALVFWYGIKRMVDDKIPPGNVITVFINIIFGSALLGFAVANFQYFVNAVTSGRNVLGTIDRIPPIDKNKPGLVLKHFEGNVTFKDVSFAYPTRPDVKVLQNFNLTIRPGQTVALVGPSGSGKSTVVHLLQRFYDATEGQVLVEGEDICNLDLKAHRYQLGCVQQEPILFEGTIAENIGLGKIGATQEEIVQAATIANAHNFIMGLPQGYETRIGELGVGMSGGEKQRIAIARALIRQPKILLLDEATSALDTQSERTVQEALDRASFGRTVIVVAHRLTTIRNADMIVVLEDGIIRETGDHEKLMALNGLYAAMVRNQGEDSARADSEEEEKMEEKDTYAGLRTNELERIRTRSETAEHDLADTISVKSRETRASKKRSEQLLSKWERMKNSTIARLFRVNRPEMLYLIGGTIASLCTGATDPVFALLYAELFDVFQDPEHMQQRINTISAIMAGVGVFRLLVELARGYLFGVAGERLVERMRKTLFATILQQEIGWFDRSENQAGMLTATLSTEASKLAQATGFQLGVMSTSVILIAVSLAVAFFYSWAITLVILAFFPLLVLGGYFQMRIQYGSKDEFHNSHALSIAQEAINADRTMTSFGLEDYFCTRFDEATKDLVKSRLKATVAYAFVYGLSLAVPNFSFCATFSLGNYLMQKQFISMSDLFRVYIVFSVGSSAIGRTASIAPDTKQAIAAAGKMFSLIDRVPAIIANVGDLPEEPFKGRIDFKHVYFRYPTRREVRAIKNFTHTIQPGQTVALVGQSGCGKSTLVQLLERFYDVSEHGPDSGIFLDGMDIRRIAPVWIRKQIGLVQQEPTLFDVSLRENIAYGDNSRELDMDEIVEAARLANIHDFIESLPEKYETPAGKSGSQLSGGQKQRIAIARALIRKPTLLLLDEATSALDTENERIVQEALDAAMKLRTSIVVAHRLSTIENADLIVVIQNGQKIESGTAAELLHAKGAFYRLHHAQGKNQ
ncbi:unnamed protein product [Calicophoron daubneyi]|uniref:Uncharacterized protein n=1 Tax=Calicophoron daubneyi TaxID=300641 RepID=A0AAV2SZ94_CALDB